MLRDFHLFCIGGLKPIYDFLSGMIKGGRSDQLIEDVPEVLRERIIRDRTDIVGVWQQILQPHSGFSGAIEEFQGGIQCYGRKKREATSHQSWQLRGDVLPHRIDEL